MTVLEIENLININYLSYLDKLNTGELGLAEAHQMLNHLHKGTTLWQISGLAKALAVYQCGE